MELELLCQVAVQFGAREWLLRTPDVVKWAMGACVRTSGEMKLQIAEVSHPRAHNFAGRRLTFQPRNAPYLQAIERFERKGMQLSQG
jgi:hypothetical protein